MERPRSPWEVHAEPLGLRGAQVANLCCIGCLCARIVWEFASELSTSHLRDVEICAHMASMSSLEITVSRSTSRKELSDVNTESRMGICFRFSFFVCPSSGSNTCQHIMNSECVGWLYFSSKKLLYRQQPSDFYVILKVRWRAEFQRFHSNRMCLLPLAISLTGQAFLHIALPGNREW